MSPEEIEQKIFAVAGVSNADQFKKGRKRLMIAVEEAVGRGLSLVAKGVSEPGIYPIIDQRSLKRSSKKEIVTKILAHIARNRRIISVRNHGNPAEMTIFADAVSVKKFFSNGSGAVST